MKAPFVSSGEPAKTPARILLVDDNDVLRRGLAQMLLREPDLIVAGEAGSRSEALAMMARLEPDLAMVDFGLKSGDSLDLVRDMRRRRPRFPVLLLTRRDDERQTERALRAGARGIVSKWASAQTVAAAVRSALAGGIQVATRSTGAAAPATPGQAQQEALLGGPPAALDPSRVGRILTRRELQVLELLGRGHDHDEIATHLQLSVKTIEVYLCNARRKLELPSFLALLCRAHDLYGGRPDESAGREET